MDLEYVAAEAKYPAAAGNGLYQAAAVNIVNDLICPFQFLGLGIVTQDIRSVGTADLKVLKGAVVHAAAVTAHHDHIAVLVDANAVNIIAFSGKAGVCLQKVHRLTGNRIRQGHIVNRAIQIFQGIGLTGGIFFLQEAGDKSALNSRTPKIKGRLGFLSGNRIQKQDLLNFYIVVLQHHYRAVIIQKRHIPAVRNLPQELAVLAVTYCRRFQGAGGKDHIPVGGQVHGLQVATAGINRPLLQKCHSIPDGDNSAGIQNIQGLSVLRYPEGLHQGIGIEGAFRADRSVRLIGIQRIIQRVLRIRHIRPFIVLPRQSLQGQGDSSQPVAGLHPFRSR